MHGKGFSEGRASELVRAGHCRSVQAARRTLEHYRASRSQMAGSSLQDPAQCMQHAVFKY